MIEIKKLYKAIIESIVPTIFVSLIGLALLYSGASLFHTLDYFKQNIKYVLYGIPIAFLFSIFINYDKENRL